MFSAGCDNQPLELEYVYQAVQYEAFRPGSVMVIANDAEYEPGVHFLHGASYTEGGYLISGLGIPFEAWLEDNLDTIPQVFGDVRFVIEGENWEIVNEYWGEYLVYVDVWWQGQGGEFVSLRYVFRRAEN